MKGIFNKLSAVTRGAATAASRGSALLIVLGMVSFMLFSGLAFSVYMRQSRLPTSFVRRTVASRHLAKAALVEAIDEIDLAIGNHPHPNVYVSSRDVSNNTDEGTEQDGLNFWSHRVFLGTGTKTKSTFNDYEKSDNMINGFSPSYADPSDTVPTLTLEGLAYVPPNLINEVRYYSQRTPTAKWHAFWFDSGRYAYTAIDVSDYFDVNRVFADAPRASCGTQRITLAHIFDDLQVGEGGNGEVLIEKAGAGAGAGDWDTKFMQKYRLYDLEGAETSFMPLVSLADFNIVWGDKQWKFGSRDCDNPFRAYLKANGDPAAIYSTDPTKQEYYRRMTFVTDGWYSGRANDKVKISDGNSTTQIKKLDLTGMQPFNTGKLKSQSSNVTFDNVIRESSTVITRLKEYISVLGVAQLWDYLDMDCNPISLAVPTLERTPMIVGVNVKQLPGLKFKRNQSEESSSRQDQYQGKQAHWKKRTDEYKMSFADRNLAVNLLAVYPFRNHGVQDEVTTFSVDGQVKLFFTADNVAMPLRPETGNSALHAENQSIGQSSFNLQQSVISIALQKQNVSIPFVKSEKNEANYEDYVKKITMKGNVSGMGGAQTILKVVYEWPYEVYDTVNSTWTPTQIDPESDPNWIIADGSECTFMPLAKNGAKEEATYVSGLLNTLRGAFQNGTLKWKVNAAVWARVSNGEKTVDLVPAGALDDRGFNNVNNSKFVNTLNGGNNYPLLRFDVKANDSTIPFSVAGMADESYALTLAKPTAIVSDPRYNHAPENWYTLSDGETSDLEPKAWVEAVEGVLGSEGRDSDIFMFTSDQAVMQSVYELAFLPRLTDLTRNTSGSFSGSYTYSFGVGNNGRTVLPASFNETHHKNLMWQTYRCFPVGNYNEDPFDEMGLVSAETGLKVCPYSDDTRVLLAAFANTPHDWRVATTNNDDVVDMDSDTFNAKYAWNEYSSDATGKLSGQCLLDVATAFKNSVKNNKGDWEAGFADMGWGTDNDELCGITLEGDDSYLYSVDKKFLYGFWHDSFAVQQQLFLIFVRAEPMMMGGGVTGQVPPQLSTRAVALVWRDPSELTGTRSIEDDSGSSNTYSMPHRTRILFYHPLD